MVSFEPDGFGPYAAASYCADYLELLAWLHRAPLWGDYDEYLRGADLRLSETFVGGGLDEPAGIPEGHDEPERLGSNESQESKILFVKDILHERAALLGDLYPFEISSDRLLRVRSNPNYLGLLALCHLHVSSDENGEAPTKVFERAVADTFRAAGLGAAVMGTSTGTDFRSALEAVCEELGLSGDANAVTHSRWRKDDGADCVVKFQFGENRTGQWVFVGQATITGSQNWKKKGNEPSGKAWKGYLCLPDNPGKFLAVPHHVQRDVWQYLCSHIDGGIVIDRLRLCAMASRECADLADAAERLERAGVAELS